MEEDMHIPLPPLPPKPGSQGELRIGGVKDPLDPKSGLNNSAQSVVNDGSKNKKKGRKVTNIQKPRRASKQQPKAQDKAQQKVGKKKKDNVPEAIERPEDLISQLAVNAVTLSKLHRPSLHEEANGRNFLSENIDQRLGRRDGAEPRQQTWESQKNPAIVLSPIQNTDSQNVSPDQERDNGSPQANRAVQPVPLSRARPYVGQSNQFLYGIPDDDEVMNYLLSLDQSQLQETFDAATEHMRTASLVIAPEEMLLLYGLYKQITDGDNNEPQPAPTRFVANQKWIAWKARMGTPADQAMRLYIWNTHRLDERFDPYINLRQAVNSNGRNGANNNRNKKERFAELPEVVIEQKEPPKAEFDRFLRSDVMSFRGSASFNSIILRGLREDVPVESHRSLISEYDRKRYTILKIQKEKASARYSTIPSPSPAKFNIPEVDPKDPYKLIQKLIDKVCKDVETQLVDTQTSDTFSGAAKPTISLRDYVFRLVRYLDKWFNEIPSFKAVGVRSLLMSTVYLARIKSRLGNEFTLTSYNIHRLFVVCMLLAAKFSEDYIIANSYWAEVAGIEMVEMNLIEEQFCNLCGFDLYISDAQLTQLYDKYTRKL